LGDTIGNRHIFGNDPDDVIAVADVAAIAVHDNLILHKQHSLQRVKMYRKHAYKREEASLDVDGMNIGRE
jgi:hypothetical protein